MARNTLEQMLDTGKSVNELITDEDMERIDPEVLRKVCEKAVAENENAVTQYLAGKEKAFGAIIGYIMKETKGKADVALAAEIVKELIKQ